MDLVTEIVKQRQWFCRPVYRNRKICIGVVDLATEIITKNDGSVTGPPKSLKTHWFYTPSYRNHLQSIGFVDRATQIV